MSFDSAWIFRICLVMAVTLILFADFLGYGGANARRNDNTEDYEDYTAEDHRPKTKSDKGDLIRISTTNNSITGFERSMKVCNCLELS